PAVGALVSWDFSRIPVFPTVRQPGRFPVQAKLAVGDVNDPLEREADSVSRNFNASDPPKILPKQVSEGSADTGVPAIVEEVLRSPGQPLDAPTRAVMEPRFGYDFSRVRVHTDPAAAESAHAVKALAYTVGSSIVFGRGQYAPQSDPGRRLLAH